MDTTETAKPIELKERDCVKFKVKSAGRRGRWYVIDDSGIETVVISDTIEGIILTVLASELTVVK